MVLAWDEFFNRKKIHLIDLQKVYDVNKIFWSVCAGQPKGVGCMMVVNFWKLSNLYRGFKNRDILQKPIVEVLITLYLIWNSTYPICTYLQNNWKSL